MKTNKSLKYFLPCLTVLAAAVSQAYAYDEEAGTELVVSGEITPKLIYFKYTGGPGDENTFFLQNYGGEQAWSGERDSGFYADFDIDLTLSNEQRDVLRLERQGFGPDNHRTRVQGGDGEIGFTGYYSNFRTNTGSIDYLLRPGTDENPVATIPPHDPTTSTSYLTMFNDDSMGASHKVERTRYGLGIKFKPDLLGKGTSLALNIDGYDRQGTTYATWVAGGGDIGLGTATPLERFQSRWRGYDKPIDENMGRFSLNFTAAPGGMFQFAYDGSHEKFNSRARTANMVDFKAAVEGPGTDPTGLTLGGTKDLHFVPDSSLTTHALRGSKTMGDTALAVGYGISKLSQDSFSSNQIASDFNKGEINTQNAYLNLNHRLTPSTSLEGHVKYYNRDNDSTPDAPGLLDREVRDEWGVRINNIESLTYGLSATFRALPVNSTLTAGWKREDTDRELQYNNLTATGNIGVWPTVSVYSDKTESDEFYLRWTARPTQGMTLRLTPSVVSADKTAFVTEAEKSLNLKAALGYAMSAQTYMNAYYHYKKKENGNQSFIDTNKPTGGPITLGTEYPQKADDTFHAAGLTFNHNPSEWVGLSASLNWVQNDFETYFFGTDRRRFEQNIVFDQRGISAFTADTWSLTLNADYQPSDRLKLRAGYMLSTTEGDLTTTTTALADVVSDKIDHTLHSVALGADYQLRNNWVLKGSYVYDRFKDKTYPVLDGNHHSVMLGAGLRF